MKRKPLLSKIKYFALGGVLSFLVAFPSYAHNSQIKDYTVPAVSTTAPAPLHQWETIYGVDYSTLELGAFYKFNYDITVEFRNTANTGTAYIANPAVWVGNTTPDDYMAFCFDASGQRITRGSSLHQTGTGVFQYNGNICIHLTGMYGIQTGSFGASNNYRTTFKYDVWNFEKIETGIPEDQLQDIQDTWYDRGYSDGFNQGVQSVDTSEAFQNGYNSGFATGQEYGFDAGVASVNTEEYYNDGYSAGQTAGYALGYQAGYLAATTPPEGAPVSPSNPKVVWTWRSALSLVWFDHSDIFDHDYYRVQGNCSLNNAVIDPTHIYRVSVVTPDDDGFVKCICTVGGHDITTDFYISGDRLGYMSFKGTTEYQDPSQDKINTYHPIVKLWDYGESGVTVDTSDLDSKLEHAQEIQETVEQTETSLFDASNTSLQSYSPEPLTDRDGSIAFVASWIQSFYEASGEFSTVITMLFIISICGTAIGYYVDKRGK